MYVWFDFYSLINYSKYIPKVEESEESGTGDVVDRRQMLSSKQHEFDWTLEKDQLEKDDIERRKKQRIRNIENIQPLSNAAASGFHDDLPHSNDSPLNNKNESNSDKGKGSS